MSGIFNCYSFFSSQTIAKFLKSLNTKLKRVNHFVKNPQISFKMNTQNHVLSSQNGFFHQNDKHSYHMNISLRKSIIHWCDKIKTLPSKYCLHMSP